MLEKSTTFAMFVFAIIELNPADFVDGLVYVKFDRHVARIWPREGRRNPGGLLSTEGLLSKGDSFLQRASSLKGPPL